MYTSPDNSFCLFDPPPPPSLGPPNPSRLAGVALEVETAESRLAEARVGVAAVVSSSSKSTTAVVIVPEVDAAAAPQVLSLTLFCWLFIIKEQSKEVRFQQTHRQSNDFFTKRKLKN